MSQRKIYALTLRKVRIFLTEHGYAIDDLLAGTELFPADLDDPYRLITHDQARRFYLNAITLHNEPGLGLEIGWTTHMSEMGPMGLAQTVARTVRDAVDMSSKSYQTYYGMIDYEYRETDDTTVFTIVCREANTALRVFLLERALGVFQASLEEMVGAEATFSEVRLDYEATGYSERYTDILRCPVRFGHANTEIHVTRTYMDKELPSYDPQALEALRGLQHSLLNRLSSAGDVVADVKLVLRREPGTFPNLDRVAEQLAMSPRTLRRKLGAANARFQDLLDAERQAVAEDYLLNSELSVQQVAEHCGFSDSQNFSQAFKRWLGMSPTEFRKTRSC
ncbi:AraC family transcriptional regulator [Congregibacter sp.]|uniref:AraC family transcriptional regulator n=1 Tax=Congregibacter sp. TaxID=2744308 RepID=UPI003F6B2062